CFMKSGPRNDRLVYLTLEQVTGFLDEIADLGLATRIIGFTGGEPFMNKAFPSMLDAVLARGHEALVLTNAMQPLWQRRDALSNLAARHGTERLTMRVSIDHYTPEPHEDERGPGSWTLVQRGVEWLAGGGFRLSVAGRTRWGEDPAAVRQGYRDLFDVWGLDVDAFDPGQLILFPEMDERIDVPEITTACWNIVGVRPQDQMCATQRMVVWRKGRPAPHLVPCTLLPFGREFDLGPRLADALGPVALNHPHCARFCVLGGASCTPS
ncbi:MAG: radical SAM protein, partial [Alphaproteobacteria bacterium]|nr:radical SAM protein [Alphaproteobacteria bacterium]